MMALCGRQLKIEKLAAMIFHFHFNFSCFFSLHKDVIAVSEAFHVISFRFILADTNNLAFELFGSLATPLKENLQTGFNGSNNHNYIQTTPPKNSFENFQVRIKKSMSDF
jgi:hypothetical protein